MGDSKITDDQVLNSLPGPLADFAAELVNGCPPLPLIIPVTSGLAAISAAIGPAVTLNSAVAGPTQATLQICLGLKPDVIAGQVLDLIFAPLRSIQSDLMKAHAGIRRKELQTKRLTLELEKALVPENDRSPDRQNIDNALGQLDRLERPLILLDGPGQMEKAFRRSFDHGLLLQSTEPEKTREIIDYWRSGRGQSEVRLIHCAQQQKPFIHSLLEGKAESALTTPNLNMFLVCDSESLSNLMLSPGLAPLRSASSFIAVSVTDEPSANFAFAAPLHGQAAWHTLIHRLFDLRQSGAHRIVEVSTDALALFYGLANQLINASKNISEEFRPFALVRIGQHWPIALILHLSGPKPHEPISLDTAEKAITLCRWLGEGQSDLRTKLAPRPDPQPEFIVQFIGKNVAPGGTLTLSACYAAYCRHCDRSAVQRLDQAAFKTAVQPVIRELYNRKMRNDLIGPQGMTRGWRGLTLLPTLVESQAAAKYDLVMG